MPANVSVEYSKAKEKFDTSASVHEKLLALQEMKSFAPKHKGGENLRREISKKIAKLKSELDKQEKVSSKKGSGPSINIKKEGAGQIVIIGMPNSGKSTFLNSLTGFNALVADYPFTTTKPQTAMMNYNGGLVQLVEVPAIVKGSSQGKAQGTQMLSLIRNADGIILLAENEKDKETVLKELENSNIFVNRKKPGIEIKQTGFKGITISGKKFLKIKESELVSFLKSFGYHNASLMLKEKTTMEKIAEVLNQKIVYKKAIILNPKKVYDREKLKEQIFFLLDKILVYTKKPGQKPDYNEPMVVKKDETIEEMALRLHKDFAKNLKFARVWGSTKFEGQRVSKDYKLQHLDTIEIS